MNVKERRQYEMLLRVRHFGRTYRDVFARVPAAPRVFAALDTAIDDLAATDVMKMSASVSARADRKAAARQVLITLLQRASRLARLLRADGRTTPPFLFPESRSDQTLLTAARQFARDAESMRVDFTAHGMGPAHISRITTAFEEAIRQCVVSRSEYIGARARIHALLSSARRNVTSIGLMLRNERPDDTALHVVWKQARRIEEKRARRGSTHGASEDPGASLPIA